MTHGIDVSEWQGKLANTQIDWNTVSQSQDFAVYRVGNGHRYDYDLAYNRQGVLACAASGSYWYIERPGTNGAPSYIEQANMWFAGAQFQQGQIAQADIEGSLNGNDQPGLLDFCNHMADLLGGDNCLMVYSNLNFAKNVFTDPAWKRFPVWVAYPNGNPNGGYPVPFGNLGPVVIHQYGVLSVPGVAGGCDVNESPFSVNDLITKYGYKANDPVGVTDMPIYRQRSDGAIFEIFMGYKFHCTQSYYFGVLGGVAAGNPPGPTGVVAYIGTDADINALPDWPGIVPPSGGNAPTSFDITLTGKATA